MSKPLFLTLLATAVVFGSTSLTSRADEKSATDEAEAVIRKSAENFVRAFNAQDAEAIGQQFTDKAEYVAEDGGIFSGREAITRMYTEFFKQYPDFKIETQIESIRFLGEGIALESGTTMVTGGKQEQPSEGRYTVIHVKQGNGWEIARVHEIDVPDSTNYQRLQELEWMVGDWIDEGDASAVITSCRWSKNKNFLLRKFEVRIAGRPAMEGTTRIGWDPLTKQIKSWTFDTEGGYAEALWSRDGNRWILKSTGVLRDGQAASATHVVTLIDSASFSWQSIDRVVGGALAEDIPELIIVRRPPAPKAAAR